MSVPSLTLELHNRVQAWAVIQQQLYPFLKQWLSSDRRLTLTCGLRRRTTKQNKRYWGRGVLAQVAEQAAPGGRMFSAETWHELMKRKFIGVEELPDGSVRGKSSTGLSTVEFSAFCDQVEAYAATELGVTFYDLAPRERDQC